MLFNMLSRFVIVFFPKKQESFNFVAAVTICSDFGAQKNKVLHCFHCFPIYFPWSDGTKCHDLRFLNVELQAHFFTLHFHFHQEAFEFLFTFCHKGGVICIYEVTDISPGNLDSSLWFIQPGISHDVFCILVKLVRWQYKALMYTFTNVEPVCCSYVQF